MNTNHTESGWLAIQDHCIHCGMQLESRPAQSIGMVIQGWEPMEYRHVNGKHECVTVHHAKPYTDANQYAAYTKVRDSLSDEDVSHG